MAKEILYLLGAGATHAEMLSSIEDIDENKYGLLISNVTQRVMRKAHSKKDSWFSINAHKFTAAKGSFNIELLISLLETNRVPEKNTQHLKKLIEKDIKTILSAPRVNTFYLHKALFELHKKIDKKEKIIGVISLNYDSVVDDAYFELHHKRPNYYQTYEKVNAELPILKLHGSFDWEIPIIPVGVNKNYLTPPYNFIWSKSYELLTKCDILRIIGCSLSQNDIGLIDLLLKAHFARDTAIEIQIIDFQSTGEKIKNNYGFFPGITLPIEIEDHLIANDAIYRGSDNPFRIWLKAKADRMLKSGALSTTYIKKCF